jgi:hypothetical protein
MECNKLQEKKNKSLEAIFLIIFYSLFAHNNRSLMGFVDQRI